MENNMKLRWFYFRRIIAEWLEKHAPKIAKRKPKPIDGAVCPRCGKPCDKLCAYLDYDAWYLFWECENYCGEFEGYVDWYPFWFGRECNTKDMERLGIEVV